jgi:hypothetical protein
MFRIFGFSFFKPNETKFFMEVITTTLRDRIAKGDSSTRNDLIDMMIKAMKEDISELEEDEKKEQFDLDSELKNAQVSISPKQENFTWLYRNVRPFLTAVSCP